MKRLAPPKRSKLAILWLLCLGQFVIALDFAIMNVMLPSLRGGLGFSEAELQWVVAAYVVAFGGFLLLGGRMADAYGRRRTLLIGLVGFTASSALAGLGSDPWQLIGGRVGQGLSAALITPSAFSLLTTVFHTDEDRRRALGAWGAVLGAGFVSGVLAGGAITEYLGWKWVFWVNVPIGIALITGILGVVPRVEHERSGQRLDVLGALLVTASVVGVVFGLTKAGLDGWSSTPALTAIVGGLLLGALFLLAEARSPAPLVPLSEVRDRTRIVMNLSNALLAGGFFGLLFILTLFLQGVMQFSPLKTGLTFAAGGLAGLSAGITSSAFARRFGTKRALVVGATVQAVATGALVLLPQTATQGFVAAGLAVVSFSGVIALVMINVSTMARVVERDQGFVGGLLATCEQIGGALGLAVVAAIANTQSAVALGTTTSDLAGYRWAIGVSAAITLAGGLVALAMREAPEAEPDLDMVAAGAEILARPPTPALDRSPA
jgi:EmrB/QacA subfamily drug resistance transporter